MGVGEGVKVGVGTGDTVGVAVAVAAGVGSGVLARTAMFAGAQAVKSMAQTKAIKLIALPVILLRIIMPPYILYISQVRVTIAYALQSSEP